MKELDVKEWRFAGKEFMIDKSFCENNDQSLFYTNSMKKVIDFETTKGKFAFVKTEPPILTDEAVNYNFSANIATINYDIIGIAHLITDNQWSEIVDTELAFQSPTESGISIMQSLGIEKGTWVLIKYK